MSNNKYVYIKKFNSTIFNQLVVGNIYNIEDNKNSYGIYKLFPYYLLEYSLYLDISDLNYHFIPLEEWRENQIDKILNN